VFEKSIKELNRVSIKVILGLGLVLVLVLGLVLGLVPLPEQFLVTPSEQCIEGPCLKHAGMTPGQY